MAYLSILNRISWCRSSSALWRCWMYSRSSSEMWGFPAQFLFFLLMSLASHEPIWLWQSLNIDYFSLFWTVENNFIKTNQSKYSIFNLHHNQIGIKLLLNFSRFTIIVNFDSLVSTHLLNILQQHSALQLNLIGFFCSRKKMSRKAGAPLAAIGSLSALTAGADIEAIGCISSKEWRPALLTFRRVTLLAVMSLTVTITCNHQNTFWVLMICTWILKFLVWKIKFDELDF